MGNKKYVVQIKIFQFKDELNLWLCKKNSNFNLIDIKIAEEGFIVIYNCYMKLNLKTYLVAKDKFNNKLGDIDITNKDKKQVDLSRKYLYSQYGVKEISIEKETVENWEEVND